MTNTIEEAHATEITWRNPVDLRVHPIVAKLPQLDDDDEDFNAWCDSLKKEEMLPVPLLITGNFIIDGRHRWRVAKRMQKDVPCVEVGEKTDAEVMMIALGTLKHRRHYTAGQIALIAYPELEAIHQAAVAQQTAFLKKGGKTPDFPVSSAAETGRGTVGLADDLGVSRETFDRAAKLHQLFNDYQDHKLKFSGETLKALGLDARKTYTLREVFWPQLMRKHQPIGLGAAVAGIGSVLEANGVTAIRKHGGGKPGVTAPGVTGRRQLELFQEVFESLVPRLEYWQGFDDKEKSQAVKTLDDSLHAMPDDLLDAMRKRVLAELQRRKEAV